MAALENRDADRDEVHFGTIISELSSCLGIHGESMLRLSGVSLEFTGELNEEGYSVTECLGESNELCEEELGLKIFHVISNSLHVTGSIPQH